MRTQAERHKTVRVGDTDRTFRDGWGGERRRRRGVGVWCVRVTGFNDGSRSLGGVIIRAAAAAAAVLWSTGYCIIMRSLLFHLC